MLRIRVLFVGRVRTCVNFTRIRQSADDIAFILTFISTKIVKELILLGRNRTLFGASDSGVFSEGRTRVVFRGSAPSRVVLPVSGRFFSGLTTSWSECSGAADSFRSSAPVVLTLHERQTISTFWHSFH